MKYKLARFLVRLILRLLARVEYRGVEQVPASGPCIGISNHAGRLDAALSYDVLDREDITMMVAEKYHKNPLFRFFVFFLDAIWVDRYGADFAAMRACLQRLEAGGVLAVAPEGTRSKTGKLIEARPGVAYLAAKAQVPIIPVGIVGSEDQSVVRSLKKFRRAQIVANVGPAFTLPPLGKKNREETLKAYTDEMMCRIAAQLPPSYHGFYADHPRLKELLEAQKVSPEIAG